MDWDNALTTFQNCQTLSESHVLYLCPLCSLYTSIPYKEGILSLCYVFDEDNHPTASQTQYGTHRADAYAKFLWMQWHIFWLDWLCHHGNQTGSQLCMPIYGFSGRPKIGNLYQQTLRIVPWWYCQSHQYAIKWAEQKIHHLVQ